MSLITKNGVPVSLKRLFQYQKFMSRLNELLNQAAKTDERLKDAITNGDYDLMTKIERSKLELNNRIYFERRNDYAERLNDLRIERQCAVELSAELAEQLKVAAGEVLAARSAVYDAERRHAEIKAKQYFVDNQLEQNRQESVRVNVDLDRHIKSRLNTVSGEMPIDLMETNQCEI